jgi:hypothetical protein
MTGAGLKKCRPRKRFLHASALARLETDKEDVFVAIKAALEITSSSD